MNNNIFSNIDGRSIIVCGFQIERNDEKLHIKMTCISEDQNAYFIIFENISKLQLSEISYPFQICGFEILDYSSRGYQNDTHFFVNDFENGKLSFFCERFEIFNADRSKFKQIWPVSLPGRYFDHKKRTSFEVLSIFISARPFRSAGGSRPGYIPGRPFP